MVYVTFMFEKEGWKCVNDVFINIQRMLLQKVILGRLKKRFSSMSKPKQLQYSRDDSHMYTIYVVSVECEGYETNKVLETFLVEVFTSVCFNISRFSSRVFLINKSNYSYSVMKQITAH